ncbi:sensor histidine kinase [Paenibacillus sp. MBLB4367]|uniref:sensor histidine kinase n=1 Tax=Paenibacillus sp. MBLB4367 TaxID=3384767 RepID=UPI0039081665
MRRSLNAMSIKSKVTLAFVFLIMLPFSALGLYSYDQAQRSMKSQLISNSQTTLKQVKYTIENKIDLIESVSNNITYNYRLQLFLGDPFSPDGNSIETYFSYAAPLVNYAMLFQKINTDKISVYMSNETIPEGFGAFYHENKASQEPWYEAFKRSDQKFLWVLRESPDSGQTFSFVQKMISIEGKDLGMTVVDVRLSDLLAPVSGTNDPSHAIVVSDERHRVIFSSGEPRPPAALSGTVMQTLSNGYSTQDGMLYVGELLKGVRLSILLAIPLPKTAGSLQVATNLAFISAMVVLLLAFYSVLKMVLRKMKTSIKQMDQAIGSGFRPILIDRKDEFGVISEKFNILLDKITVLMSDMIKKETMHKDAQLIALQSQINPHFIYNTLDIFSAKMELAGQFDVSDAMADFGKMMRYNMDGKSKFTTLEAEIRYLEQYMNLQKVKFGDSVRFRVNVPDRLLPFKMIKFILQPIVENSMKHGFANRQTLDVDIDIWLQSESCICVSVRDNGAGIAPERLTAINEQFRTSVYAAKSSEFREGIGLGNINERLKLYYGEDYPIRMNSEHGLFAQTVLTIPYDETGEEESDVHGINRR